MTSTVKSNRPKPIDSVLESVDHTGSSKRSHTEMLHGTMRLA